MDYDNEVDVQLARQLGCMGTEDQETLIRKFQQILAPQVDLNAESCRFFLDMNNWNLQAALGSFYDYNAHEVVGQLPTMQFVEDVTIGEGESVAPNCNFLKTWRIRNPGPNPWPAGCCLRHVHGELLAETASVDVKQLQPHESVDVSVVMASPCQTGAFTSRWRMFNGEGLPFGESIWCIIMVEDSGLLSLTQKLASTSCGDQLHYNSLSSPQDGVADANNPFRTQLKNARGADQACENPPGSSSAYGVQNETPAGKSNYIDFDPPASPNGSSALYSAVSAALPNYNMRSTAQWQGGVLSEERATSSGTPSIAIPAGGRETAGGGLWRLLDDGIYVPRVPPCTPSSPSPISNALSVVQPLQPLYLMPPPGKDDSMED